MTKTELAWIAGFVDGEGCISFNKTIHKSGHSLCPNVVIVNTKPEAIQRISILIPGGNIHIQNHPNSKPAHVLKYGGRHAINFLKKIRPYLFLKTQQADLLLMLDTRPRCNGRPIPKCDLEIRDTVEHRIHQLNQRGCHAC